ncbi:MAG: hypothetical protein IPP64_11890 [Bacteroidetes bacterium]|nr:hypothetical protein [Bacteroidota bacterium]
MKKNILLFFSFFLVCSLSIRGREVAASVDKSNLDKIVGSWSEAHNNWDLKKFNELYASDVLFYCQQLKKEACVSKKSSLFKPDEVFSQKIISEISYDLYSNNVVKASFIKEVKTTKRVKEYPSYLLLYKYGSDYKIVGESDLVTDRNLKYKLDVDNLVLSSLPYKSSKLTDENNSSNFSIYLIFILFFGLVGVVFLFYLRSQKKTVVVPVISPVIMPIVIADDILQAKEKLEPLSVLTEEEINRKKGFEFEKYIVEKFPKSYFKILVWRGDKGVNGRYAESNAEPDIVFGFTHNGIEKKIAVECKFRSYRFNNALDIGASQFKRYKQFEVDQNIDVYVVFGVGGLPDNPIDLYLLKLSDLMSNIVDVETLNKSCKAIGIDFHYKNDIEKLT